MNKTKKKEMKHKATWPIRAQANKTISNNVNVKLLELLSELDYGEGVI